jgi:hypothetical protein
MSNVSMIRLSKEPLVFEPNQGQAIESFSFKHTHTRYKAL